MGIGGAESHIYTLAIEQQKLGHTVCCISGGGEMAEMLADAGCMTKTLPLDRKDPRSLYLSRRELLYYIRDCKYDVIHAHSRIPAAILKSVEREAKARGCVIVTTAHMKFRTTPPLDALSYWGMGTIAVSEDVGEYLVREYKLPKNKIEIINNGIDTEKFKPADSESRAEMRAALGISRDSYVLCSSCRTSASRAGLALWLCKNAKSILRDGDVLLLLLSGRVGNEADRLEDIRSEAEKVNAVLSRKAVIIVEGECDVSKYLAAADAFAGVSRAALEGMSCGLPTCICGNEGYGGIVSEENADALARANFTGRGGRFCAEAMLRDIATMKKDREKTGRFCREYIVSKLSAREMAERTCDFYRRQREKKALPELLFIGSYGTGNFGDNAMAEVLCRELGDRYKLHFVVKDKAAFSKVSDAHAILREDIAGIIRAAKQSRCTVFGGGNLIQDDTSMRSLMYYRYILRLCRRYSKKLAIYANGIGPLNRDESFLIRDEMLSLSDHMSFRDRESYLDAECASLRDDIIQGSDPVYLCSATSDAPAGRESMPRSLREHLGDKKYMLIFPRGGVNSRDIYELSHFASMLEMREGIACVIIPLDMKTDLDIAMKIHKLTPRSCIYLGSKLDGWRLYEILREAECAVGARLHAAILAVSAQCPFIGIDRDERIKNNLEHAGVGAYVRTGKCSLPVLEQAYKNEVRRVADGEYKKAAEEQLALAKKDLASLVCFIE